MKIQLYWLLLAALLLLSGKADAANNKKPFVIPELQEWRGAQGMFTPTATSRIFSGIHDPGCSLLRLHPGSCIPEKIRL